MRRWGRVSRHQKQGESSRQRSTGLCNLWCIVTTRPPGHEYTPCPSTPSQGEWIDSARLSFSIGIALRWEQAIDSHGVVMKHSNRPFPKSSRNGFLTPLFPWFDSGCKNRRISASFKLDGQPRGAYSAFKPQQTRTIIQSFSSGLFLQPRLIKKNTKRSKIVFFINFFGLIRDQIL